MRLWKYVAFRYSTTRGCLRERLWRRHSTARPKGDGDKRENRRPYLCATIPGGEVFQFCKKGKNIPPLQFEMKQAVEDFQRYEKNCRCRLPFLSADWERRKRPVAGPAGPLRGGGKHGFCLNKGVNPAGADGKRTAPRE